MPQARITRQHRTAGARWPPTTGGRWSPWTLETLTSTGPSTSSANSGDRRREGRVEPLLVGLQLHPILSGISGHSAATLLGLAAAVSAAVVATRIVWEFTVPYLIRLLDRRPSQRARRIGARARLVVGWSGMRGAVSLAAALALPLPTGAGQGFPTGT
jgi:hypothetical protein